MSPTLLLAHGAGAGQAHPVMQTWARLLRTLGTVVPFEYDYMAAGRRAPQRLPRLLETHARHLEQARADHGDPVVLVGKSMGGRVGCHLATQTDVAAVVCLGYPLRTPKGTMRDEVLRELRTPILFVQGTRDRLCPLDLLDEVRGTMTVPTALHVVDDGDHSLIVAKRTLQATGTRQQDHDRAALDAIRAFLTDVLADPASPARTCG